MAPTVSTRGHRETWLKPPRKSPGTRPTGPGSRHLSRSPVLPSVREPADEPKDRPPRLHPDLGAALGTRASTVAARLPRTLPPGKPLPLAHASTSPTTEKLSRKTRRA